MHQSEIGATELGILQPVGPFPARCEAQLDGSIRDNVLFDAEVGHVEAVEDILRSEQQMGPLVDGQMQLRTADVLVRIAKGPVPLPGDHFDWLSVSLQGNWLPGIQCLGMGCLPWQQVQMGEGQRAQDGHSLIDGVAVAGDPDHQQHRNHGPGDFNPDIASNRRSIRPVASAGSIDQNGVEHHAHHTKKDNRGKGDQKTEQVADLFSLQGGRRSQPAIGLLPQPVAAEHNADDKGHQQDEVEGLHGVAIRTWFGLPPSRRM